MFISKHCILIHCVGTDYGLVAIGVISTTDLDSACLLCCVTCFQLSRQEFVNVNVGHATSHENPQEELL